MKKIVFFLAIMVFLAACSQAPAQEAASVTDQVEGKEIVEKAEPVEPTTTQGDQSSSGDADANTSEVASGEPAELESYQPVKLAECRVDSKLPSEAEKILNTIVETDWVMGLEDARVTVVEYGDFQ